MSIPENHGILNNRLNALKDNNGNIEDNYFKSLGYEYIFVEDGHDICSVISAFEKVKGTDHPVVVHIRTQKGKGYSLLKTIVRNGIGPIPLTLSQANLQVMYLQKTTEKLRRSFYLIR